MKLSGLILLSVFFCAMQAKAQNTEHQDSLRRELILEKEYTPNIRDASKINAYPELEAPKASKSQVEYADFSIPYDVNPQLIALPVGTYFETISHSKKRGYISAGVSSFVDIDGDLGYQILNNEKNQLSIFGSHRSSDGNVKYLQSDEEKQKMKINDNLVGLTYNHLSGNTRFFSDVSYIHSTFNYYGNFLSLMSARSQAPELPEIDKTTNQADQIIDVNIGLSVKERDAFNYLFKINFSNFNQKHVLGVGQTGPKENFIHMNMDLNREWDSDKLLGLKAFYKGSFYSLTDKEVYAYRPIDYNSYSDIGLNPYFFYDGGNWNIRLGVLADVLLNYNKNLNVAPDFELNFHPSEKVLVYMSAKGGVATNNMKNTYYKNRYAVPFMRIQDSYSLLDATMGLKFSVANFGFNLFAGYKDTKNEHFYSQYFSVMNVAEGEPVIIGSNFSRPEYNDAQVIKIGGDLRYKLTDEIDAGLKAVYYNWNLKETELGSIKNAAWGTPDFIGDLMLGYQFSSLPLRFDLSYHLEAGRKTMCTTTLQYLSGSSSTWEELKEEMTMKNINNLNIQAVYSINDTFSLFGRANNILFQKYDILYGYPAQNFSIMGGVNIRF